MISLAKIQRIINQTYHANADSYAASSASSLLLPIESIIQLIYSDFTQYHQNLKQLLKQENIISDYKSYDRSSSLLDPITNQNSMSNIDSKNQHQISRLTGYKRIFISLLIISGVSVMLIILEMS